MKSTEQQRYDRLLAVGGHTGLIRMDEQGEKRLKKLRVEAQKYRDDIARLNVLWNELQGFGFKEGFILQLLDENGENLISGTIAGFNKNNGRISLEMGKSTNLLSSESRPVSGISVSRLAMLLSKEAERNAKNL